MPKTTLWHCGHEKTRANTAPFRKNGRCRICYQKTQDDYKARQAAKQAAALAAIPMETGTPSDAIKKAAPSEPEDVRLARQVRKKLLKSARTDSALVQVSKQIIEEHKATTAGSADYMMSDRARAMLAERQARMDSLASDEVYLGHVSVLLAESRISKLPPGYSLYKDGVCVAGDGATPELVTVETETTLTVLPEPAPLQIEDAVVLPDEPCICNHAAERHEADARGVRGSCALCIGRCQLYTPISEAMEQRHERDDM